MGQRRCNRGRNDGPHLPPAQGREGAGVGGWRGERVRRRKRFCDESTSVQAKGRIRFTLRGTAWGVLLPFPDKRRNGQP